MVDGALQVCEGLLVVGIDEEGSEAMIGGGLPGGCAPGGVVLGAVFFGPEVEGAEGEGPLGTSNSDLIPLCVAITGLGDGIDVGVL